jgi:hypothetical protein
MIQRRIEGKSWAEIAQEFGLSGPSTARSRFTKLTGITDYKIKGQALKQLVDADLLDQIKGQAIKKANKVVKDMDDVFPEPPISQFKPDPKPTIPEAPSWDEFVKKPSSSIDDKVEAVLPDDPLEAAAKQKAAQLQVSKQKYKIEAQSNVVDKHLDDVTKWNGTVWKMHQQGQGYSAIVKQTGVSFEDLDNYIWNRLVNENDGNIFKALAQKKNSEKGVEFVNEKIASMKAKGWTDQDIYEQWEFTKFDLDINNIATPIKPSPHQYQSVSSPSYSSSYTPPTPAQYKVHYDAGETQAGYARPAKRDLDAWHATAPQMDPEAYKYTKAYTGSSYHIYNDALRNGTWTSSSSTRSAIEAIDRAMLPAPNDMELIRHVGENAFRGQNISTMGGTVYSDAGFLSTSIKDTVFQNTVRLELEVPAGTPGRWAAPFSNHPSEQEYILGRGLKWLITKVEEKPGGLYGGKQWVIRMKVIG